MHEENVMHFRDRKQTGRLLAKQVIKYKGQPCVVCALPRGGVVLGVEIATALRAPLDLVIVRKLGRPFAQEYAVSAVTEDGYMATNDAEVQKLDTAWFTQAVLEALDEAKRRRRRYLAGRPSIGLTGKVAIIVDDGIATGLTMLAAIQAVKAQKPAKIVVAVPVLPGDIVPQLRERVDEVIALEVAAEYRGSVSAYYTTFPQVTDSEIIQLIASLDKQTTRPA